MRQAEDINKEGEKGTQFERQTRHLRPDYEGKLVAFC
jgi:hypothetical protein